MPPAVPADADWSGDMYQAPCTRVHCTDNAGDSCQCLSPSDGPKSFGVHAPLVPESPLRRLMSAGLDVTTQCTPNVSFTMTIDTGRTDLNPGESLAAHTLLEDLISGPDRYLVLDRPLPHAPARPRSGLLLAGVRRGVVSHNVRKQSGGGD